MDFRKGLRMTAAAVSAAMILSGSYMVLFVSDGYRKGRQSYGKWRDEYTDSGERASGRAGSEGTKRDNIEAEEQNKKNDISDEILPEDAPKPVVVDFAGLQTLNSDVVAWIQLPAVNVSYPVLQAEDNVYYLHRALDGQEMFAGSLFLDAENDPGFSDDNSIIYGHNMRDGSMFAKLQDYNDRNIYEKCPYFWICTAQGSYLYQIYSVCTADIGTEVFLRNFSGPLSYENWTGRMYCNSETETTANLPDGGKTVTLSTCTANPRERQVVQGMRIAEISEKK